MTNMDKFLFMDKKPTYSKQVINSTDKVVDNLYINTWGLHPRIKSLDNSWINLIVFGGIFSLFCDKNEK